MKALSLAVLAALVVAGLASASTRPSLRVLRTDPITVRGTHFRARERVRVTLRYATTRKTRTVRTSSTGAFTAALDTPATLDPCTDGFSVVAVGGSGERAVVKFVPRECPPPD
jgi:hypothetical protein